MVNVLPQLGLESIDAAAANRAARVARYGEAMVAKMEAAGRIPGAAPAPAPAPAAPGVMSAPVEAPGMMGRMGAQVPTLTRGVRGGLSALRGLGAVAARAAGPAAGALAVGSEAMDTADVANDPNATKIDVATRAAEGVGRLGAMGAGAGLGLVAGGPIGAAIGGTAGYFAPNLVYSARDWLQGRGPGATPVPRGSEPTSAAVPESTITPTTPAALADPLLQQQADSNKAAQVMQQTNAALPAGGSTEVPMRNPAMPFGERGALAGTDMERINARIRAINSSPEALAGINEAQRLNGTGITATRDLNGRLVLSNAPGAVKKVYQAADGTTTTDYTKTEPYLSGVARAEAEKSQLGNIEDARALQQARGAIQRATTVHDRAVATELYKVEEQKQQSARTERLHAATESRKSDIEHGKLLVEAGAKGASATEALAKSENERMRTQAALQHLRDNPGDYAGAAAVSAGRSQGMGANTFMPSTTGNDVIIGNRRTGASEIQTPTRFVTEANISATMTARKMTRAQAIAAYKQQGLDVSRLK
jgi:hypothetical protein